jgi:hypothetical protein
MGVSNAVVQQVLLRQTGRPVMGWSRAEGGKRAFGQARAGLRVAVRGFWGDAKASMRWPVRESARAGQVTLTGRNRRAGTYPLSF